MTRRSAVNRDLFLRVARRVERGWCQKHYSADANDEHTGMFADNAAKWCLFGALIRENAGLSETLLLYDMVGAEENRSLVEWNDHPDRTKQEVIDLLLRAAYSQDDMAEAFQGEPAEEAAAV